MPTLSRTTPRHSRILRRDPSKRTNPVRNEDKRVVKVDSLKQPAEVTKPVEKTVTCNTKQTTFTFFRIRIKLRPQVSQKFGLYR